MKINYNVTIDSFTFWLDSPINGVRYTKLFGITHLNKNDKFAIASILSGVPMHEIDLEKFNFKRAKKKL